MKVTIYLVRHGETNFNVRERIQGTSDSPLTLYGQQQAMDLGSALRNVPFTRVFASPSLRARDTAEYLTEYHPLPIVIEEKLQEFDFGSLEGAKMPDIPEIIEECWGKRDWSAYGGLTAEQFCVQIREALDSMIQKATTSDVILACTHGLWMRFALEMFGSEEYRSYARACEQERKFPIPNCGVAKLVYEDGQYRIEGLPFTADDLRQQEQKRVRFIYVRHGETRFNKGKRIQGRCDSPLTEEGIQNLNDTAEALKNVPYRRIYCSPLYRALHTAQLIAREQTEIIPVRELIEFNFGDLDGRHFEPIQDFVRKKHVDMDYHAMHGENKEDVKRRVGLAVHRIYDEHNDGDTVVLVAHGTLYYLLVEGFFGYTRAQLEAIAQSKNQKPTPNGGIASFVCENGKFKDLHIMTDAKRFGETN